MTKTSVNFYACFEFPAQWSNIKDPDFISRVRTFLFGHVYILIPLTEDKCLILDKTTKGFLVKPFERKAVDLISNLVNNGVQVYEVPVKREINKSLELFTCTGFVKKVLNIKNFWIITPRQLWRYLDERT